MKLPILVTASLLLLIALFPCQNVTVAEKEYFTYQATWGPERSEKVINARKEQRHLFLFTSPPSVVTVDTRQPFVWAIIGLEAFAAMAIGAITWALVRSPKALSDAGVSGVSAPQTPVSRLP